MQFQERPIPGAMFVEQQGSEGADEERRFWTRNVRVSPKLAPSEPRSQEQKSEWRQRREQPGSRERQDAREGEAGSHEHDGDRQAIDAFVEIQKDRRTFHYYWVSVDRVCRWNVRRLVRT
jgi:hypothetical protein